MGGIAGPQATTCAGMRFAGPLAERAEARPRSSGRPGRRCSASDLSIVGGGDGARGRGVGRPGPEPTRRPPCRRAGRRAGGRPCPTATGSPTRRRPAGLDFAHINGMSGEYRFAEMMGPGAAGLRAAVVPLAGRRVADTGGAFEDRSAASGLRRPACPTPGSARSGSTSTTTAGWTCSRSTAPSIQSARLPRPCLAAPAVPDPRDGAGACGHAPGPRRGLSAAVRSARSSTRAARGRTSLRRLPRSRCSGPRPSCRECPGRPGTSRCPC